MTHVTFDKPTLADISHVAANMRGADVAELAAFGRDTPAATLRASVVLSGGTARVAKADGVPVAIYGEKRIALGNIGVIWLLGTDDLYRARFTYIREAKRMVARARADGRRLENVVHMANTDSIRMLAALGFTFGEPQPTGHGHEMCARFWLEV